MIRAELKFDGGSRGNPGPAACAWVLSTTAHYSDDRVLDAPFRNVRKKGVYLGETTNNVAEYLGLVSGLQEAVESGVTHLAIFGDSKLVICHLNGEWRCRADNLKPYLDRAKDLLTKIPNWSAYHNRREMNTEADALVNSVLDAQLA